MSLMNINDTTFLSLLFIILVLLVLRSVLASLIHNNINEIDDPEAYLKPNDFDEYHFKSSFQSTEQLFRLDPPNSPSSLKSNSSEDIQRQLDSIQLIDDSPNPYTVYRETDFKSDHESQIIDEQISNRLTELNNEMNQKVLEQQCFKWPDIMRDYLISLEGSIMTQTVLNEEHDRTFDLLNTIRSDLLDIIETKEHFKTTLNAVIFNLILIMHLEREAKDERQKTRKINRRIHMSLIRIKNKVISSTKAVLVKLFEKALELKQYGDCIPDENGFVQISLDNDSCDINIWDESDSVLDKFYDCEDFEYFDHNSSEDSDSDESNSDRSKQYELNTSLNNILDDFDNLSVKFSSEGSDMLEKEF